MVAYALCPGCKMDSPLHCLGSADRLAPEGVYGGFMCSCDCRDAIDEALTYLANLDKKLGIKDD